jgi:acyl phosphate:glycerol-3-phosphate acyltransferase
MQTFSFTLDIATLLAVLVAYLMGSIAFAVLVCRVMGLPDPRTQGSGNPGANNVLRTGSKGAAVLTLLLDAAKGFIPVAACASALGANFGLDNSRTLALVGLAAFMGHLWPIFFRFKGGKGVATAAGVLLAWGWGWFALAAGVWALVALVTRYASMAGIVSALVLGAAAIVHVVHTGDVWLAGGVVVMSALLIYRHRSNIQKLRAGTESKMGARVAS